MLPPCLVLAVSVTRSDPSTCCYQRPSLPASWCVAFTLAVCTDQCCILTTLSYSARFLAQMFIWPICVTRTSLIVFAIFYGAATGAFVSLFSPGVAQLGEVRVFYWRVLSQPRR